MPPKNVARELLAMAGDSAIAPAVRAQAAPCWGRAEGWKRDLAVDAAIEADELTVRRSLASTLKQRSHDKKLGAAIEKLDRADADLGPTLSWLAA